MLLKKSLFVTSALLISWLHMHAADRQAILAKGDSAFEGRNYLQAMEAYEQLLVDGAYSGQMINRLSFIYDGLGAVDKSMFYLSFLSRKHPSEMLELKMHEMAEKYKLEGYDFKEINFLMTRFRQNRETIMVYLLYTTFGLALLILLVAISRYQVPVALHFCYLLAVLVSFLVLNLNFENDYLIVSESRLMLRQDPSSAAKVVTTVRKGDRMVLEKYDKDWSLVRFREVKGYVRTDLCLQVI